MPQFDGEYLFRPRASAAVAIKQLIMNSQLVVGRRQYLRQRSAVSRADCAAPRCAAASRRAEAAKLARAIKAVLGAAIKIGGTTLRDYVNADGAPGYFRQKLFVYERAGERCRVCKSPIKQFTQGQRSTYWCSTCQR